jgi:hypothetical protein
MMQLITYFPHERLLLLQGSDLRGAGEKTAYLIRDALIYLKVTNIVHVCTVN